MISSFRQPVVGVRTDPSTETKGRLTPGSTTPLAFDASIQPLTGRERETLPEGLREKGAFRLYTSFALRTDNQKSKEPADKVTLNDREHIVIRVEPWQNGVIPHFKAIVSESDD